jgi:protein subunit release factor A
MLDLSPASDAYKRLSKHVETCKPCASELESFKKKSESIKSYIPTIQMDKELKESFAREIEDVFKIMDFNTSTRLKKNVTSKFKAIDQFGLDFLGIIKSKRMILVYLALSIVYLGIKISI